MTRRTTGEHAGAAYSSGNAPPGAAPASRIGGVITSTALTLVVVLAVYLLLDRFTSRGRRERQLETPAVADDAGESI